MDWGCRACGGTNPAGTRFCGHCGTPNDGPGAADERRLITALFADISGFTTLADSLDAEALHAVISPVIGLLAGIAERYGGTLAKYAGDAVLVFFGAPVAQEDHAARAVLCAQSMHGELADALPRLAPEAHRLELHIGVNSGRVIAGMFGGDIRTDYSILGDAVNVAQRLESVAPPGETYVGELTRQLTAGEFDFEALGELTLKGKTKPVAAWRLVGRRSGGAASPRAAARFVGREHELATAVDAVRDPGRAGSAVCLTAEAGGGKTRLTQEVRALAEEGGAVWLEARSVSYGASLAYWPVVDLLRRSFGIKIEQDPRLAGQALLGSLAMEGLPEVAPHFARLLGLPTPPTAPDVGDLEPEAFQRELHEAFVAWLVRLASVQPVVLAVEDLHWADASTVELLVRVSRIVSTHRVVLYLTGRPEAGPVMDRVVDAIADPRRIALGPLERSATESLVTSVLGGPASARLIDTVVERAAGNPFYACELVAALQESGRLVVDGGRWDLAEGLDASDLPATIEGVLSARMDLLPRTTVNVLQMASVIGRRVNTALLEAIADGVPDLSRALDELVAVGLVDRVVIDAEEMLTFHHALMVDVAYSRLVRSERRDLHRRVAEAAEVIYGTGDDVIDLLARHFYLAEAGVKAVNYLEQAAARSRRLYANEEAILHLRRAIELTRATARLTSRLPGLLLDLADLEELVARYDEAATLYEEVRGLTDDVRAWKGLACVYRKAGRFENALALVDQAFGTEALRAQDLSALWLERVATLAVEGRYQEAVEAAEAALGLLPQPTGRLAGEVLLHLARAEESLDRLPEALEHALRAQQIFDAGRDLRGLTSAARVVGGIYWQLDRTDEAATTLARALELAERTGSTEEVGGCLINLGMAELRRGRLADGIACDRRALELFTRVGHGSGRANAHANLAEKLALSGELDEAILHAEAGLQLARVLGDPMAIADICRTKALVRLRQGRARDATEEAEESVRLFLEMGARADAGKALEVAAEALSQLGEDERAREVLSRARSLVDC